MVGGLAMSIAVLLSPDVLFALLAVQQRINQSALLFAGLGPPELVTLIVLTLAAAIALAHLSRVRAAGMILLGLLLSTVGTDLATGTLRLTMGLDQLQDGVPFRPVALGLIVVADSAICLVSPTLLLRTYARQVAGWTGLRPSSDTAFGTQPLAAHVPILSSSHAWWFERSTSRRLSSAMYAWPVTKMLPATNETSPSIIAMNRRPVKIFLSMLLMLYQRFGCFKAMQSRLQFPGCRGILREHAIKFAT